MTYTCITEGKNATVWSGSALNCPGSNNEITLPHDRFLNEGAFGTCNDGSVVARSLSVDNNFYFSQLNVTVTPDTAGRRIECLDVVIISIDQSFVVIPTTTGLSYP